MVVAAIPLPRGTVVVIAWAAVAGAMTAEKIGMAMGTSMLVAPEATVTLAQATTAAIPTVPLVAETLVTAEELPGTPTKAATPTGEEVEVEVQVAAETRTDRAEAETRTEEEVDPPGTRTVETRGEMTTVVGAAAEAETRMHPGATMTALHPGGTQMTHHPDTEEVRQQKQMEVVAATIRTEAHPGIVTTMVPAQEAHQGQWAQETIVPGDPPGGHLGTNAP